MAFSDLVKVTALVAFTHPTEHGMFHGDPNNSDERAKHPDVPAYLVDRLIEEGKVERFKGTTNAAAAAPATDESGFAMAKAEGIGMYAITGPGLDEPEKVKGKAKAEARFEELKAAAAAPAAGDAPVD